MTFKEHCTELFKELFFYTHSPEYRQLQRLYKRIYEAQEENNMIKISKEEAKERLKALDAERRHLCFILNEPEPSPKAGDVWEYEDGEKYLVTYQYGLYQAVHLEEGIPWGDPVAIPENPFHDDAHRFTYRGKLNTVFVERAKYPTAKAGGTSRKNHESKVLKA